MDRLVPLRWVLLCLMLGLLLTMLVAWGAVTGVTSETRKGKFEQASLAVASFPGLIQESWAQTMDQITGQAAYKYRAVPRPVAELTGFVPIPSAKGVAPVRLVMRGDTARADPGWRLFGGAFMVAGRPTNAVILVGPDFRVRKIWRVNEKGAALSRDVSQARKIVHGLALLPDGSIVVTFDDGSSIQRIDRCGHRLWLRSGVYNHVVSYNPDDGTLWSIRWNGFKNARATLLNASAPEAGFVQLDAKTGRILREFTVGQIMDANPRISLFDIARDDRNMVRTNASGFHGVWQRSPFHFNDVEPLTAARAAAFPEFSPGDLLISSRTLNALFVLDPKSLRVNWYRAGATLRQHDPDWAKNGTFTVFNNRMGLKSSEIVSVDPRDLTRKVVFNGAKIGFYSRIRGRHMRSGRGDLLVASPQQGRAFEIGSDGNLLMDYYNLGPKGTGLNFALTEFNWVPSDTFTPKELSCTNS